MLLFPPSFFFCWLTRNPLVCFYVYQWHTVLCLAWGLRSVVRGFEPRPHHHLQTATMNTFLLHLCASFPWPRNTLPQTGWLSTTVLCHLTFLKSGIPKSVSSGWKIKVLLSLCSFWKPRGRNFPGLSGVWRLPASLGSWLHPSSLHTRGRTAVSTSACAVGSLPAALLGLQVIALRAHLDNPR